MAGRGTKSRPNRLKVLHGEKHGDRINHAEPIVPAGMPEMPGDLDEVAETEWLRVCLIMTDNGTITTLDREALVSYCEAVSDRRRNRALMQRVGDWVTNAKTGKMDIAPWVYLHEKADHRVRMWANELGMTPSSRSRVVSTKPKTGGIQARNRA